MKKASYVRDLISFCIILAIVRDGEPGPAGNGPERGVGLGRSCPSSRRRPLPPSPSLPSVSSAMTTAADNSWMPTGRHQVHLGASLARTLKARQSANGPTKSTKPKAEREFYSFRCGYPPPLLSVIWVHLKRLHRQLQARVHRCHPVRHHRNSETEGRGWPLDRYRR